MSVNDVANSNLPEVHSGIKLHFTLVFSAYDIIQIFAPYMMRWFYDIKLLRYDPATSQTKINMDVRVAVG